MTRFSRFFFGLALTAALGCSDATVVDYTAGGDDHAKTGKADASIDAIIVDFEFDGELVVNSAWNPEKQVESQLLFTIGQLNGENSVGRLDKVVLTQVETRDTEEGTAIRYHATMPVAWGDRDDVPTGYELILPRDVSHAAQKTFAERHGHTCVDWAAHDVDAGTMWYYYRPHRSGCALDESEIVRLQATVSVSDINTTGKYPEYHEVWKDDRLEVLAIFGKFEHGATSGSDPGIRSFDEFVDDLIDDFGGLEVETTPADLPAHVGVDTPDVTITARLEDGRLVQVVVLLVDGVQSPGDNFDARYEELSKTADLIAYSGHSGLGANIRALAKKGSWVQGQYAIVFMNGCDTYAYVDSELADAHIAVNPDDPNGTKYLDIITNAMPAPASRSSGNTLALVSALMDIDAPRTYERIFSEFNRSQVVLVSGEEDNVYHPGMNDGSGDPAPFEPQTHTGAVSKDEEAHFGTDLVPAGSYTVTLTGTGDADLYVRDGDAPTVDVFDCRPYLTGSSETCRMELSAPTTIHAMVRGWAASSEFTLEIR